MKTFDPFQTIHMDNEHAGLLQDCKICAQIRQAGVMNFESFEWNEIMERMHVLEYTCEHCKKEVTDIGDFVRGLTMCKQCFDSLCR